MRYPPDHKRATRARILKAAARQLLARGLAGATVHKVMAQAGLSHGGFYTHFASKEALIKEALEWVMAERRARLVAGLDHLEGEEWLTHVIGRYVCRRHRDDAAEGCALPALAGEVARAGPKVGRSFERGVTALVAEFAGRMPVSAAAIAGSGASPNARERALATLALCAGGVMLARAVEDDGLSGDILRACRRFALGGISR